MKLSNPANARPLDRMLRHVAIPFRGPIGGDGEAEKMARRPRAPPPLPRRRARRGYPVAS